MKKSNEQLIKAFKKANVQARRRILEKAGYYSPEAYLNSLMKKEVKKSPTSKKTIKKEESIIDYVVAFDTTGSMSSYIDDVKKHIETLIPQLFSKGINLKMTIIAFGDYCDMRSENNFGNAYQVSKHTDDQNYLINFVKGAQNTDGGDDDEFYELVIQKIRKEVPWRKGSKRVVLFIADSNPHRLDYIYFARSIDIDWRQEATLAAAKGISFDTMSIHGKAYPWYEELAKITKGIYMPFQTAGKTAEVIGASLYARGTTASKETFVSSYSTAASSGDAELIGVYKSLSVLLDE